MIVAGEIVLALDLDVFALKLRAWDTEKLSVRLCVNQECGHDIGDQNYACMRDTVTRLLDRGRTGNSPAADRHLISRI
jgi:hypothetical protein